MKNVKLRAAFLFAAFITLFIGAYFVGKYAHSEELRNGISMIGVAMISGMMAATIPRK